MPDIVLHTIGYEGSSIDDFLTTLESIGVDLLIDIREVPISRKRGFSKLSLSERLAGIGIEYLHLKGLGDPKPGRIAAREGRYADFRRIFGSHLKSQAAQVDIQRGIVAASNKLACLLCFERDHSQCHRSIVANEMAIRGGFQLIHLGVRDTLAPKSRVGSERTHHGTVAAGG